MVDLATIDDAGRFYVDAGRVHESFTMADVPELDDGPLMYGLAPEDGYEPTTLEDGLDAYFAGLSAKQGEAGLAAELRMNLAEALATPRRPDTCQPRQTRRPSRRRPYRRSSLKARLS